MGNTVHIGITSDAINKIEVYLHTNESTGKIERDIKVHHLDSLWRTQDIYCALEGIDNKEEILVRQSPSCLTYYIKIAKFREEFRMKLSRY